MSLAVVSELRISLQYCLRGGHGEDTVRPKEKKGKEEPQMKKEQEKKKVFEKPVLFKQEKYQTAGDYHCHQVKEECSPYQAKA